MVGAWTMPYPGISADRTEEGLYTERTYIVATSRQLHSSPSPSSSIASGKSPQNEFRTGKRDIGTPGTSRELTGITRENPHEHYHCERWHDDLLQRLGQGPSRNPVARLAVELRHVGRPDAVSRRARLPSRGARSSWPWTIQPTVGWERHEWIRRRSSRSDQGLGSRGHHNGRPFDRRR